MHDLVIRGGTVVDGQEACTIDADGLLVTPGFDVPVPAGYEQALALSS